MPTYEFECEKCKKEFALVLKIKEQEKGNFKCPNCGSTQVKKLLSTFYAQTSKKS